MFLMPLHHVLQTLKKLKVYGQLFLYICSISLGNNDKLYILSSFLKNENLDYIRFSLNNKLT